MERWEYVEVRARGDHYSIYIFPADGIDITTIKHAFKNQGRFQLEKQDNAVYLYFGNHEHKYSSLIIILNILGQRGWEAFSATDSEGSRSILLKRRIE